MSPSRLSAGFWRPFLSFAFLCSFLLAASAPAQDVVTVGAVTASGTTVDVPVSIRDVSGTPLGMDRPAGSKIQSLSIKVVYSPAAAVQTVTFSRAGITAGLTPTLEFAPANPGDISLLATFQESTNPIPFTLNAPAPGDVVAHLVFTLSSSAAPGSTISLTLDPSLTQLSDEGGTPATKETVANGALALVNGGITVPALSLALSPTLLNVALNGTAQGTVQISSAVGSPTTVTLSSSSPSIVTVPASATIPAGGQTASFTASGIAIGSATITGQLPAGLGGGTAAISAQVIGPTLAFSPANPRFTAGSTSTMTATLGSIQSSDAVVALSSSDPTVLTVPATVVIPTGSQEADFIVNALKVGGVTLQGQLSQALGGATGATFVEVVSGCVAPRAPQPGGPQQADSGSSYDITWTPVSPATEYQIDEAADPAFSTATTRTIVASKATYTHSGVADVRYYYRVRARNHAGLCDDTSASSSSISVLVKASLLRVIPVAGSVRGGFGSFFKTSIQIYNPRDVTISGRIVYHPAGLSGSASDPVLAYAIGPRNTLVYDDFLQAFAQSGLGSVDVLAEGGTVPMMVVRVFNDAGADGTSGVSEDLIGPEGMLQRGETGVLIAPADFKRFRLNVGVRTLEQGATMSITVRDKDGITVKTLAKSYGPTFFIQVGSDELLSSFALSGSETISFTITGGSAIVYGGVTDNVTNDPAFQIAKKEQ